MAEAQHATAAANEALSPNGRALPEDRVIGRITPLRERSSEGKVRKVGRYARQMWVRADQIEFDPEYQRQINVERVVELVEKWDDEAVGVFVLSKRPDGRLYAIDGQHRILAALTRYAREPIELLCWVEEGLSVAQEAKLFWLFNDERLHPQAADTFKSRLAAGDVEAHRIKAICDEVGVNLVRTNQNVVRPGDCNAYVTITEIERMAGERGLRRVLWILRTAWPQMREALKANYIRGTYLALRASQLDVVDQEFAERLAQYTPIDIDQRARRHQLKVGGSLQLAIAVVLVTDVYEAQFNESVRVMSSRPRNQEAATRRMQIRHVVVHQIEGYATAPSRLRAARELREPHDPKNPPFYEDPRWQALDGVSSRGMAPSLTGD